MAHANLTKGLVRRWREDFIRNSALEEIKQPEIGFDQLTREQRHVVNFVRRKLDRPMSDQLDDPARIIIVSRAGCGKSTILNNIKYLLELRKRDEPDFHFRMGVLTGSAAYHLGINTIHNCFKLPAKFTGDFLQRIRNGQVFKPETLQEFRRIQWIIIDELSLVSLRLFHAIDVIMRTADPDRSHVPFASRSLVICGDPLQPLTIADHPIFFPVYQLNDHPYLETSRAYMEIKDVFHLTRPMRQSGDCDNQKFRGFLNRLRFDSTNSADVTFARSRLQKNLAARELAEFRDAPHLFSLKCHVKKHNMEMLHRNFRANEIISISNGLDVLHIAISAPVVLCKNLATEIGAVNGARATVTDVIFQDGMDQPGVFPRRVRCIIVDIKGYRGPKYTTSRCSGYPIFRCTEKVYCYDLLAYVNVRKFPIQLGYAITKHKSQGLTLNRVAVNLGDREIWAKLDYLCASRVCKWNEIMFTDNEIAETRFRDKSEEIFAATKLQKYEMARLRRIAH